MFSLCFVSGQKKTLQLFEILFCVDITIRQHVTFCIVVLELVAYLDRWALCSSGVFFYIHVLHKCLFMSYFNVFSSYGD